MAGLDLVGGGGGGGCVPALAKRGANFIIISVLERQYLVSISTILPLNPSNHLFIVFKIPLFPRHSTIFEFFNHSRKR